MKKLFLSILGVLILTFSINSCQKEISCFNEIQDGTETGVDCGGDCINHCYVSNIKYNGSDMEVVDISAVFDNKFTSSIDSVTKEGLSLGILFKLDNDAEIVVGFFNDDIAVSCLDVGVYTTDITEAFEATEFKYASVTVTNSVGKFVTDSLTVGNINLIKCDSDEKIFSGKFNVEVKNESSEETVKISGSFTDILYVKSF